jgi:pimeloyl-ACP methyl ester carboxylesterase
MNDFEDTEPLAVNGTMLATAVKGEGQPLFFVHGGVSDLRTWSNQVDAYSDRFRVIVYSRRYSRPNTPILEDADDPIEVHVNDLLALMGKLAHGPAHVVGHSWGALVALLAARSAPEKFSSMTLIEPPVVSLFVSIPPKPLQMLSLLLKAPRLAIAIAKLGGGALGPAEKAFRRGQDKRAIELFGNGVLGAQYFKALSEKRYRQVWENRGPDRAQALHHSFPSLIGESFLDVSMPVLLVSGADSPAVFGLLNEALNQRLADTRICTIENASHIVHENAPEAFNAALARFLKSVG